MHGNGHYKLANGSEYTGEWFDNKFHGKGTQTWPDGRRYEGDFHHGVK